MYAFLTMNAKVKGNVHHSGGVEEKIFVVTIKKQNALLLKKKDLYASQMMSARDKDYAMIMIMFAREILIVDSIYIY